MDINLRHPISGMTCLHIVGLTGYYPLAIYLLKHGADVDVLDATKRTPKQVAEDHGHLDIRDLLLHWKKPKVVAFAPDFEKSKINKP